MLVLQGRFVFEATRDEEEPIWMQLELIYGKAKCIHPNFCLMHERYKYEETVEPGLVDKPGQYHAHLGSESNGEQHYASRDNRQTELSPEAEPPNLPAGLCCASQ